jgi:hypothetical protein
VKDLTLCRFHPRLPQLQVNILSATGEIQERVLDTDEPNSKNPNKNDKEECINPFRRNRLEDKENLEDESVFETITCAFGVHPCCRKPGYKYYPLPSTNVCFLFIIRTYRNYKYILSFDRVVNIVSMCLQIMAIMILC